MSDSHTGSARLARRFFAYEPSEAAILFCCVVAGMSLLIRPAMTLLRNTDAPQWVSTMVLVFGMVFLAAAPFALVYYVYTRIRLFVSRRRTQADRQRFADRLLAALRAGERPEYSLYLRPFFSDDTFRWRDFGDTSPNTWRYGLKLDLENAVAQAIDCHLPVVTLGGVNRGFGPGEIRVDDRDWQRDILDLMTHARLIVAIPFAQPATKWEVQQIVAGGFLSKTVFLVPPLKGSRRIATALSERPRPIAEVYAASQRIFEQERIWLPEMDKPGGLFWYEPARETWIRRDFTDKSDYTPRSLRKLLFDLRAAEAGRRP